MKRLSLAAGIFLASVSASGLAIAADPTFGDCKTTGRFGSVPLKTLEPDTITVGTGLPSPGFWNGNSPEQVRDGFEYCIAAEIAFRAGVHHLKIMNMAWDQFISGAAKGYDFAMASTTITEPRKKVLSFSIPYFTSDLGVIIRAGSDVTQDNLVSKRIGVLQGNVGADWVTNMLKPTTRASLFQSQQDMITALAARQLDAVITDTTLVLAAAKGTNGVLVVPGQFKIDQGYGIVAPLDTPNQAAIDKDVAEIRENGSLNALAEAYLAPMFGGNPNNIPFWEIK